MRTTVVDSVTVLGLEHLLNKPVIRFLVSTLRVRHVLVLARKKSTVV